MQMKLATVAIAFLVFVPGAAAEVIKHERSGLQFELPAGWKTRVNAGNLVAEPPDKKTYLSFAMIEEADIVSYVSKWAEGMDALADMQVDVNNQISEVNGLPQLYSAGTATLEGKPIQWDLTIVTGAKKVLAVMALGENLDGDAVQTLYASIKKLKQGPSDGSDPEPVEE